jgi:hypothetical protein
LEARLPLDLSTETGQHGSIVLVWPNTLEASIWLRETAPDDAQFFGAALAIEPRYLSNVAEAAISDGFTVQER